MTSSHWYTSPSWFVQSPFKAIQAHSHHHILWQWIQQTNFALCEEILPFLCPKSLASHFHWMIPGCSIVREEEKWIFLPILSTPYILSINHFPLITSHSFSIPFSACSLLLMNSSAWLLRILSHPLLRSRNEGIFRSFQKNSDESHTLALLVIMEVQKGYSKDGDESKFYNWLALFYESRTSISVMAQS